MNLTNKWDLPAPLVSAVSSAWYHKDGHISVTSLLKSPRQRWLEIRHATELVEDASDRIWALLGSAVHRVLQHANPDGHLIEERLRTTVNGWTLTGMADALDSDSVLTDYKVTSVWSFVLADHKEWEQQLNVYAWLYGLIGFPVRGARIVGILRDWSSAKAGDADYPSVPVGVKWLPLWTTIEQQEFVEARVRVHQEAESFADDDLPLCSAEERWARSPSFAVMRAGRKSAVRLFDSRAQAEQMMEQLSGTHWITERPGQSIKCERYCSVKAFCNQYRGASAAKVTDAS